MSTNKSPEDPPAKACGARIRSLDDGSETTCTLPHGHEGQHLGEHPNRG
jgi:hypothetical protein